MKKVVLLSFSLILGLVLSQLIPNITNPEFFESSKSITNFLLFTCLSFIMINVGREFELDKTKIKSYATDYGVAMASAAIPWIFVAIYFMLLLPPEYLGNWDAWKENLLLSRFSAPTSAGILFTMLLAVGLKNSWIYKKIQILAIFDDLDTILLMIPLQIMMIGVKLPLLLIVIIITILLWYGWKFLNKFSIPQTWRAITTYSIIIVLLSNFTYWGTTKLFGAGNGIHLEVLLPAFVLGMSIKSVHYTSKIEVRYTNIISYVFMLLVGLVTPQFIGVDTLTASLNAKTITATFVEMEWSTIAFHVLMVTLLSNIGKMLPIFFYKDRALKERVALSIGMFARGEVGAGIIVLSIGYSLGGYILTIAMLSLVLNLVLTGFFIMYVKKLAYQVYNKE
ncbi:MAG: sodium:proton antiporter [Bacteroidetes bacterium]|nr:sodium:proton antiporter [Bacteroidota bacterium]